MGRRVTIGPVSRTHVMSARRRTHHPWRILGVGAVGILLATTLSVILFGPDIPTRVGIGIPGDPVRVVSYDRERQQIAVLLIPADTVVDVVRGYGAYPVGSVWKLDLLDKRRGVLFTETLEEATGIPVRFFIDPFDQIQPGGSAQSDMQGVFSLPTLIRLMVAPGRSNLPVSILVSLLRSIPSMNPTDVRVFDLSRSGILAKETQADGSGATAIDSPRLSLLLGTHIEDAAIRQENLRIAVFNTTPAPGLAQKASRVMEQAGFHVVTVGNNDAIRPDRCVIRAKEDVLKSVSVRTLEYLYGCSVQEETDPSVSDVSVFLGTAYERRFQPFR